MESKVVFLIPAAGYAERMQAFKPLLPLAGKPALAWLLDTVRSAGVDRIDVVTGYQAAQLERALTAPDIRFVHNPDYAQGMLTSVCAGIRANLDSPPAGFLLQPGDCPLLPAEVIREILDAAELFPDRFIVPCYRGKKGHPLYIPTERAIELLSFQGENGLKGFMTPFNPRMVRIDVPHEAILVDMDTPEEYRAVSERVASGRPDAAEESRRWLFVRHGQIRQHAEPILLGQTDVPLSEIGKEEASRAAASIRERQAGRPIRLIVTSDLTRARQTAEIIQKQIAPKAEILADADLRELHLGQIDGMFVRAFRESWPDAYRRRGQAMTEYRFDPSAEDYRDLERRAQAAMERLRQDTAGDVLIVTHDGVIKTLFSRWWEVPLEDFLKVRYATGRFFVREEPPQTDP